MKIFLKTIKILSLISIFFIAGATLASADSGSGSVTVGISNVSPTLTSPTATAITTTSATIGATITSLGVPNATSHGTCISTNPNPAGTACTAIPVMPSLGAFSRMQAGLTPGTLYYYRGYATNTSGTVYSPGGTFTTLALPTLVSPTATAITTTSATIGARITSLGVPNATSHGTCISTNPNPAGTACTAIPVIPSLGTFARMQAGLIPGTLYYYRGYATNTSGTSYSPGGTFTTLSPVGTLTASNCIISASGSTCNTSLNWTTTNPVATSAVTTPTNITVGSGNSGTNVTYAISEGTRTFYLYHNSVLLAQATATATKSVPLTPTGLSATASSCGTGTINLSWTASLGATSYSLRDGSNPPFYTGASTSYSHTGLPAGSSHSYTVLASNSGGSSVYSSAVARIAPSLCTYTVTGTAGPGGIISPATTTVNSGSTTTLTITPNPGYSINTATGCSGSRSGSTYTTGAIIANCTVTATFSALTYTVTGTAGPNGTISPASRTGIGYNSTTTFTVTPNSGYVTSSASGCGGSLSGTTYTTGAITANCTVTVAFANTPVNGSCAATHYNCTTGTSVSNVSNPTNWTWGCNGANGGTSTSATACSENKVMSGTISSSAPSCTIASGGSSCNVTITWATTNPVATSAVTATGMTTVNGNSGSQAMAVPYSSRIFYLYNNAVQLASTSVTSSCTSGTSWDGTKCANILPVANAGPDKAITLPTSTSAPTGATATDTAPGTISSTVWTQVGVTPSVATIANSTTLTPTFNNLTTAGTYTFRLTATDGLGGTGTDNMNVVVSPPSLTMSGTLTSSLPSCTIALNGSSCPVTLTFAVTNPESVLGSAVTSNTNNSGVASAFFPIVPPVTTGTVDSGTKTLVAIPYSTRTFYLYNNAKSLVPTSPSGGGITVTSSCTPGTSWDGTKCANILPVANAGPDKAITLPTSTSAPTGATATDTAPGTISSTVWTQVGVTPSVATIANSTTLTPTFNNLTTAGTYTFRLTATDGLGGTGTDNMNVVVSPPSLTMSGTISSSAPSCTIASGGSSCNVTITWATTNPVATSAVTATGMTSVNGNSGSQAMAVPYSSRIFYLYNNAVQLASTSVTSSCTSGTTWNGSTCAVNTYTVTGTAGSGGTISPATRTVNSGSTTTFTVTPNSGYSASASGCSGSLSGTTYTTGPITANCTVTATFSAVTYTVTGTAGANGTISPASRTVNSGSTTTFTVTPNSGYSASASGCSGSLSGTTYTTGAIIANCTVTATFSALTYTVTGTAGPNGTISPASRTGIGYNSTTTFTVTPNSGYVTSSASGCGGSLSGTTYTTGPITANCTVTVAFANTPVNGSCAPTHYNCTTGTSVSNVSNPTNWTWGCNGANGGTSTSATACSENKVMSGTISSSAPSCTIASGGSSCNVTITWATTNPVATSAVTATGMTTVNGNSGSQAMAVPYSSRIFYLYNNAVQLASTSVTSSCTSGTTWNGSICAANAVPVVTLVANPTSGMVNVVNPTLTWTTTNTPTSCTATGDWSGAKTTTGGSATQGVLTTVKTYSYSLVCTNASGNSNTATATVVVSGGATSGSITASPCTILAGGSTCPVTLNWSTTNPVGTSTIRTPLSTSIPAIYTANSGVNQVYTYAASTAPTTATFYLLNNGYNISASSTVSCVSNYHWGGSSCVIDTATATFTVNNATAATIFKGRSATLRWNSSLATSCTGTGFNTGGALTNLTGVPVTPLVTTTYRLSCTNASGVPVVIDRTVKVIDLDIIEN